MAEEEDAADSRFSLGKDYYACDAYDNLDTGNRQSVIDTARKMAELTIPSVFPPEGYQTGDSLPGNNQSIGAMAVNTLTSMLMFMAFPPGQPIMRLKPIEFRLQSEIDADPQLYANTLLAMSRLELAHRELLQTTTIATAYTGYIKLLLVAGNALWKHLKRKSPTYHRPDSYVVKRAYDGTPLLTIHKETVQLDTLDEDHQEFIKELKGAEWSEGKKTWELEVDLYSVCKLHTDSSGEQTWLFWQECEKEILPETDLEADYDAPPMWPGWLIPVYGDNWGRSYCEEYRGDLYTLEAHASAINDGASLAALSLLLVAPGGPSLKSVREARNLSVLPGRADDLSVFRTDKSADFNFVANNLEQVARRVSAAFLMQTSIQRSGERVTAEEVRRVGQELDKALGGLYTQIAQGNQKVCIVRAVRLNEDEFDDLPPIPQDVVEIQVITGVDALGQSTEADALQEYAQAGIQAFPKMFEVVHDASNYFTRMAAAKGIKPDGLVKKADQVAQEQQAQQQQVAMQSMIDKGAGPAVKGMADFAMQQQQQTPTQ